MLAYTGTARSEVGDLLRYLGACIVDSVLLFRDINKEVLLTHRAFMLGRRLFATASAIDEKYEVMFPAEVVICLSQQNFTSMLLQQLRQRLGKGDRKSTRLNSSH